MKKLYLFLFLVFSVTLYAQDQFYVYQKSGAVKSFLCENVDSIVYSRIDTAGITQADFVTQNICLQDTTIVIPVGSIDSVSFQKPETVLCENVITLSPDFLQYVTGLEDDTILYVSSSIPQKLLPEIGQILYYEGSIPVLPNGFVGRVTALSNENVRWKIVTETPSILEVYDRFILAEPYLSEKTEKELRASTLSLYNNKFETNIDKLGLWSSLTLTVYKTDPPIMNIDKNQVKFFYLMFDCGVDVGAGIKKELEGKIDVPVPLAPQIKIPIPNSLFSVKLDPAVYVCMKGKLELDCSFRNQYRERFGVVFNEGKWIPFAHPVHAVAAKPSADVKLNLDGSMGFGLQFGVGVGFTLGNDNMGFQGRIGPELSANLSFDVGKALDQVSFYAANKEAKIGTEVSWSISAMLPQLVKDKLEDAGLEAKWSIRNSFAKDFSYLFPDFTNPKVDYKNENSTDVQVTSTASRKTYLNSYVGLALYKEKQPVTHEGIKLYEGHELMIGANFPNLEEKKTYQVYPTVKMFGTLFLADQMAEFTTGEKPEEPVIPDEPDRPDPEPDDPDKPQKSVIIGTWNYAPNCASILPGNPLDNSNTRGLITFNTDGTYFYTLYNGPYKTGWHGTYTIEPFNNPNEYKIILSETPDIIEFRMGRWTLGSVDSIYVTFKDDDTVVVVETGNEDMIFSRSSINHPREDLLPYIIVGKAIYIYDFNGSGGGMT